MNQSRVPAQPHLKIFNEKQYHEFPVLQQQGGLVESYLGRLSAILNKSIQNHGKVFAFRLDLQHPIFFQPIDTSCLSNQHLHDFIKGLRRRLKLYEKAKKAAGIRVHSVEFDYVWAREYSSNSAKPHFHLLLLFNGHTFNTLGCFSNEHESLYNRMAESWAEALGLHASEGAKYLHIPENSQYMVRCGGSEQHSDVFCRASYLTKVSTKNFHDGFHVFGGSRV